VTERAKQVKETEVQKSTVFGEAEYAGNEVPPSKKKSIFFSKKYFSARIDYSHLVGEHKSDKFHEATDFYF
jgi:hypothetical protein